MSKETFGEYAAFTTQGGVRFQKHNKLISEKQVPPEVVDYLRRKLDKPSRPKPSEEELAKMREDSLKVPEELQMTPEEVAQSESKLEREDFEIDEDTPPDMPESPEEGDRGAVPDPRAEPAPLNHDDEMSEFMEAVSIHTASLDDMAQALYERFGIYTVYLRKLPQPDEINPLTAQQFTKYHQGIAYQAAVYARSQGILEQDPESKRKIMEANREASQGFQTDPVAHTVRENREANTFQHRTSVRGAKQEATTRISHTVDERGRTRVVREDAPQ